MDVIDDIICKNDVIDNVNPELKPELKPKKKKRIPIYVLTEPRRIAMEKGRLIRDENARLRKEKRELEQREKTRLYEDKLLQKAISIRKRQIKNDYLNRIEDDDTPDDVIQKMRQEMNKPKQKPSIPDIIPHKFIFC